jgi:hypothetical protein
MGEIPAQVPGRRVMSKGKDEIRKQLPSLSFAEKINILESSALEVWR